MVGSTALSFVLKFLRMKRLFLVFSFTVLSGWSYSQSDTLPKTAFTRMYLPVWEEARDHCLDVARAMPEDLYSYRPTDVSKSFGEQMIHIGYTIELLTKRYVQGMEVVPNATDANSMTKAEILELLEQGFAYTWIRTDFKFESLAEAAALNRFFFGDEMAQRVIDNNWVILPECTGIWWATS